MSLLIISDEGGKRDSVCWTVWQLRQFIYFMFTEQKECNDCAAVFQPQINAKEDFDFKKPSKPTLIVVWVVSKIHTKRFDQIPVERLSDVSRCSLFLTESKQEISKNKGAHKSTYVCDKKNMQVYLSSNSFPYLKWSHNLVSPWAACQHFQRAWRTSALVLGAQNFFKIKLFFKNLK